MFILYAGRKTLKNDAETKYLDKNNVADIKHVDKRMTLNERY